MSSVSYRSPADWVSVRLFGVNGAEPLASGREAATPRGGGGFPPMACLSGLLANFKSSERKSLQKQWVKKSRDLECCGQFSNNLIRHNIWPIQANIY